MLYARAVCMTRPQGEYLAPRATLRKAGCGHKQCEAGFVNWDDGRYGRAMTASQTPRRSAPRRSSPTPSRPAYPPRRSSGTALTKRARSPRRPSSASFRLSRQTVFFLGLLVGYLVAVYLIDRTGGSKLLVSVFTVVFIALLMIVRPPRHWLDWVGYLAMLVTGVLWIAGIFGEWALYLALAGDVLLIWLEGTVVRGQDVRVVDRCEERAESVDGPGSAVNGREEIGNQA